VVERLQGARSQSAQTMSEYAVVLTVITIAVVAAIGALSTAVGATLTSTVSLL
jgi:Flp pilus assembly pilin Flp